MSSPIDDAAFVRTQYATEENLRARKSAYAGAEGDDPRQFAFEAVARAAPRRVLEVGVPDLDRGLSELARVLKPRGRLVAVTNAVDHLQELWELAGRPSSVRQFTFRSENGEEALRRHFGNVVRRDARGWITMDNQTIRRFAASWDALADLATPDRSSSRFACDATRPCSSPRRPPRPHLQSRDAHVG